jgi:Fe-Mn family superoxide dismutase
MGFTMTKQYTPRTWPNLKGLSGLSDALLETHFALYAGYVKNTNLLTEQLSALTKEGKASGTNPAYAEMTRRLGFEYGGMVLHEYYFDNMKAGGSPAPTSGKLFDAAVKSFGSFETYLADFKGVATMRGIGWAVTFQDPTTGLLSNHWITLHNDGAPAGYRPVLVMDAWEHAFVPDYKPTERAKYVEAYFQNIDWAAAEKRVA